MVSAWEFPTSIEACGVEYAIRTDYRVVIDLLSALAEIENSADADSIKHYFQSLVIMQIMFPDCDNIPHDHWKEAISKVSDFIDMGLTRCNKSVKTMDWNQDAPIIIPAINKVLNCEIRAKDYIHWWTFLGAYMEIGDSLFSNVIHIRRKKAKQKNLDKHEIEFYKENKHLIDFIHCDKRSEEEKEGLRSYFGYKKK